MAKKQNQNPEPDDKEQSQRFIETARQLEVDESGSVFEKTLENIKQDVGHAHRLKEKSAP